MLHSSSLSSPSSMTQLPYHFEEPSSPSDLALAAAQPSPNTPPHVYKAIRNKVIEEDLDFYIHSYKEQSLRYVCRFPDCKGRRDSKTKQHLSLAIFTSKSNARNHVRRDMNIVDAFKCSCGQTFGSEDSAKRHCATKSAGKVHECPECGHGFERKDYWEVHVKERKCRKANRVTPPRHQQQQQQQEQQRESPQLSHPHSHSQLHLKLQYSPPPQSINHPYIIDLQPTSYNHYYSYPQPECAMPTQYPDNNGMSYGVHLSHSYHHHSNAYAPCSVQYYN